jgi:hypothetical protein
MSNLELRKTGRWELDTQEKGQFRVYNAEVIRKIARNSDAGGRMYCEKCGLAFSANYMQYVRLGNFRSGHVCRDCKKRYNLKAD